MPFSMNPRTDLQNELLLFKSIKLIMGSDEALF